MKQLLKSFLVAFTIFTLSHQAQAETAQMNPEQCRDVVSVFENIQLQQILSQNGLCYLSVHPRDSYSTLVYRDYLLSSQGLLMIFNSFSPEESPASTGAREFYFFPQEFKSFQWHVEGENLVVQGFNNHVLKFNLKSAQLASMSGATIEVKSEVNPENQGGVEILSFQGLFLDAGFTTGDSPSAKPSRSSVWKNPHNQICRLKNQDTFDYVKGEPKLKSAQEMSSIIQRKCADFKQN